MIEPDEIERKVCEALGEGTEVAAIDLTGTRDHYRAVVVSPAFEGKMTIKRHRMVYAALAEEMKGAIHALTLETLTPAEHDAA